MNQFPPEEKLDPRVSAQMHEAQELIDSFPPEMIEPPTIAPELVDLLFDCLDSFVVKVPDTLTRNEDGAPLMTLFSADLPGIAIEITLSFDEFATDDGLKPNQASLEIFVSDTRQPPIGLGSPKDGSVSLRQAVEVNVFQNNTAIPGGATAIGSLYFAPVSLIRNRDLELSCKKIC